MIDYLDITIAVFVTLGLLKAMPLRWFSKREAAFDESLKRLRKRGLHK